MKMAILLAFTNVHAAGSNIQNCHLDWLLRTQILNFLNAYFSEFDQICANVRSDKAFYVMLIVNNYRVALKSLSTYCLIGRRYQNHCFQCKSQGNLCCIGQYICIDNTYISCNGTLSALSTASNFHR